MRVYRVSPIVQYGLFYRLSYFSKLNFELGNIAEVDFNNRKILSIVVESLDMNDAKVEIRQANFKTKKIENKLPESVEKFLNERQFLEIQKFAKSYLISVGEVFFAMFGDMRNSGTEKSLPLGEGFREGVMTLFPDNLSKKVKGGISGKQIFQSLEILRRENKLINLKKIIIKDFSFTKYTGYQAPHISQLHLLFLYLEMWCTSPSPMERAGVRLVLETNSLGICEKYFLDNYSGKLKFEIEESDNKSKKFIYNKKEKDGQILDEEIVKEIFKEKTFLFVLASGYVSRIYCKDCGESYKCENEKSVKINCTGVYSILNDDEGRYLFCKECKYKKTLKDDQYLICKKCGGWGLFPYGEGGQKVYEELLKSRFEKEKIVFVDESVKKMSDKKLVEMVRVFFTGSSQPQILLGSKRVLKVLESLEEKKVQSIILALGPLVKGKYFDADEKFLQLLSELESVSSKIYIGKNDGDEILLENFKDTKKFIENEMEMRKNFSLPPFNKILSFGFDYRSKRGVDKFLNDGGKMGQYTEVKKGRKVIYYWVVNKEFVLENSFLIESLRGMGEIVISNAVYDQFF